MSKAETKSPKNLKKNGMYYGVHCLKNLHKKM